MFLREGNSLFRQFPAQALGIAVEYQAVHACEDGAFHIGGGIVHKDAFCRIQMEAVTQQAENLRLGLDRFSSAETIRPSKYSEPGIRGK